MTPTEINIERKRLAKEIGGRAHVAISIGGVEGLSIHGAVYPDGICSDHRFGVDADDWPELFDLLRAKWAEHRADYHRETVRKMALEIIRITADQGTCTDAALRAGEFSAEEVARFGSEACRDANEIASNGPFEIAVVASANAA